jgi:hypothetical protein
LSSVEQGETFLRLEVKRGDPDSFKRLASRDFRGSTEDLALTDQYECKMGQRRKVSAGTDASTARNDRIDVVVQQITEALGDYWPGSGEAFRKDIGPQEHQCADFSLGKWLVYAGRMAAHKVVL